MIKQTREILNKNLDSLRMMRSVQLKRMDMLADKADLVLKEKKMPSGKKYYCARRRGDIRAAYLGSSASDAVNDVREVRYLKVSLSRIDSNIAAIEAALNRLADVSYEGVNQSLPASYRDPRLSYAMPKTEKASRWKAEKQRIKDQYRPYMPEGLKIRTDDGELVRSKSEALIYNHLLARGVTFVYEMPILIEGFVFWADFAVLSEIDYETEILIEHQGLMSDESYRRHFYEKLYKYMCAGYIQGINIFYTFDALDGGFDKTPVDDIINTRVKPKLLA